MTIHNNTYAIMATSSSIRFYIWERFTIPFIIITVIFIVVILRNKKKVQSRKAKIIVIAIGGIIITYFILWCVFFANYKQDTRRDFYINGKIINGKSMLD